MKFILTAILCFCCVIAVSAQTEKSEFREDTTENKVTKLSLAREDSDGNIEENVEAFSPKDIPIFCYVDLSSAKPTSVQLNFIAVKVKGVRPNSKIISTRYKTKKGENAVTFTGKPKKEWTEGAYRVDILLNGKLAVSKEFLVELETK